MAESGDLVSAWAAAETALPSGWRLDGLRCTSTGLDAAQRSDGWRAVAIGPDGEEIVTDADDPADALLKLAVQVQ